MSIPNFNNLFQDLGPQGILDFLLSKIEANDLSKEEALAMLSAVHEEMTERGGTDSKVFQSYNNFMKFLERDKPDLFEYVVANWKDKKEAHPSLRGDQSTDIDGTDAMEDNSKTTETKLDVGFKEVKETPGGSGDEEEIQESGESEEETENQTETISKVEDKVELEESSEEPEQDDKDIKDEKKDDETESTEDEKEEVEEETESRELEESDEEQPEREETDNETEPEIETNDQPGETTSEPEESGTERESRGGQEETEWPEMEQPESGEVHDDLEEEGETPPGEE